MSRESYLTLKQAAEEYGLSYTAMRRDAERRILPAFRTGRKYFISRDAAECYAEKGRHLQEQAADGYTLKEVMSILPLSYAFLIELIKKGNLEAVKCGRRYIVPKPALDDFLQRSRVSE